MGACSSQHELALNPEQATIRDLRILVDAQDQKLAEQTKSLEAHFDEIEHKSAKLSELSRELEQSKRDLKETRELHEERTQHHLSVLGEIRSLSTVPELARDKRSP